MDSVSLSAVSSAVTGLSQAQTGDAVQIAVLKKALDIQAQGAMQLVQAAAQTVPNNPPHLGNTVNEFA